MSERIDISAISTRPEDLQAITAEINEQNTQHDQAKALTNESLAKVVNLDIAERQLTSYQELITKAFPVPYTALGQKSIELYGLLENAQSDELPLSTKNQERLAAIEAEVELALSLVSSKAEDAIAAIREQEVEAVMAKASKQREQLVTSIRQEIDEVEATIALYGGNDDESAAANAWPIPQALSGEERKEFVSVIEEGLQIRQNPDTTFFTQDIIPLTPAEREREIAIVERAKNLNTNRDASRLITYYLAERVGEVVTVEDIVGFVYAVDPDSSDQVHYRSRVTTILGPKVQGKRLQKALADEYGLSLQYGIRLLKEELGNGQSRERRRTRIYSAIEDPTAAKIGIINRIQARLEGGAKGVVMDELEAPTAPEIVPAAPRPIEDEDDFTHIIEEKDVKPVDEEVWVEKFQQDIERAITRLEADYQFEDDLLRGSVIRNFASSAILGTKIGLERLVNARFMSKGQMNSDVMTRQQRVLSLLLNSNPNILGKGKKHRAEAVAMIDMAIAKRLKELAKK